MTVVEGEALGDPLPANKGGESLSPFTRTFFNGDDGMPAAAVAGPGDTGRTGSTTAGV